MKTVIRLVGALLTVILLSACFSTTQAPQSASDSNNPNSAKIYVIRQSHFVGSADNFAVYVNGQQIGRLGNGNHLLWVTPPGQTVVSATPGASAIVFSHNDNSAVSFNAEKGQTYYVLFRLPPQINFTTLKAQIELLPTAQGQALLSTVK